MWIHDGIVAKTVANSYFGYELLYVNICLVASSKKEVGID
jgi:hypothetical protein